MKRIFGKQVILITASVLLFMFAGSSAARYLMGLAQKGRVLRHEPPTFFAHLVEQLYPQDRVKGVSQVQEWTRGGPFKFVLLDSQGKVVFPSDGTLPLPWDKIQKPSAAYGFEALTLPDQASSSLFHYIPPGSPGRGGKPLSGLVRLEGEPAQYLMIQQRDPYPSQTELGVDPFLVMFAALVISVGFGTALALWFLFYSLRKKALLADQVLSELQGGNLKARFPITKMDELGLAMSRFNKMANEIERLVEHVRNAERSRMALLQELAHDLRTPVASLRNLLATIEKTNDNATVKSASVRADSSSKALLKLAAKEVEYFERLVEDLLVLAQVSEPRYHADRAPIYIADLIQSEADQIARKYESQGKNVSLVDLLPEDHFEIRGDGHLLRRLFRNALENAFSFTRSKVRMSLERDGPHRVKILFSDDGKGFSESALMAYGERRVTRVLDEQNGGRLSVGLGSVIMKTVAQIHGGTVVAHNRLAPNGDVLGAEILVTLPVSTEI